MSQILPESENVNLLWTGGWDSTFQLLRLLLTHQHCVTPYYLIDESRPSTGVEIRTIRRIKEHLFREFPHTQELLQPTQYYSVGDIPPDEELTSAYRGITREKTMGCQYDWLARFCRQRAISGMQLSIHRDDKAHLVLEHFVAENQTKSPSAFHVDPEFGHTHEYALFRFFSFPIFNLSKVEMAKISEEQGWGEIMEMTWFCHCPTRSMKPCGRCKPCTYTIEEGFGRRIPVSSRITSIAVKLFVRPLRPVVKRMKSCPAEG